MAEKADKNTSGQGAPFSLPADLTVLSPEQLAELRGVAEAEINQILETRRQDQLSRMTELVQSVKKIDARVAAIQNEAAETEAQFEALTAQIRPPAAAQPDGDDGEAGTETPPADPATDPA